MFGAEAHPQIGVRCDRAMKLRLFIGSARESLDVAYAIQEELEHAIEPTVWTQGIFEPSKTAIESLTEQLESYDAAVLVFTPDDATLVRGEQKRVTRDNVVFELGLFVGALGRKRTFMLVPRGVKDLHLPTDLAGVTTLDYDHHREDGNLNAALGPACNKIKKMLIKGYGTNVAAGGHDAGSLERLLLSRAYRLCFNPTNKASKRMVFAKGGVILEGNNRNEHSWRLYRKALELVQLGGEVHSRFAYDAQSDRWVHTNDSDTKSIRGQYLEPIA